ncbi:hypothetical protein DFJ73DRAFT_96309 [Zopfochytrium polystomum]|nr:hypothetical protein DFJ73DRAFT_96309 [Zopfochytrium polystomum]
MIETGRSSGANCTAGPAAVIQLCPCDDANVTSLSCAASYPRITITSPPNPGVFWKNAYDWGTCGCSLNSSSSSSTDTSTALAPLPPVNPAVIPLPCVNASNWDAAVAGCQSSGKVVVDWVCKANETKVTCADPTDPLPVDPACRAAYTDKLQNGCKKQQHLRFPLLPRRHRLQLGMPDAVHLLVVVVVRVVDHRDDVVERVDPVGGASADAAWCAVEDGLGSGGGCGCAWGRGGLVSHLVDAPGQCDFFFIFYFF